MAPRSVPSPSACTTILRCTHVYTWLCSRASALVYWALMMLGHGHETWPNHISALINLISVEQQHAYDTCRSWIMYDAGP